jgi:hypothetical protein
MRRRGGRGYSVAWRISWEETFVLELDWLSKDGQRRGAGVSPVLFIIHVMDGVYCFWRLASLVGVAVKGMDGKIVHLKF